MQIPQVDSISSDPEHGRLLMRQLSRQLKRRDEDKLPTIWLEASCSADNTIAMMGATHPYLWEVLTDIIDLLYSNSLMAAQGQTALRYLQQIGEEDGYTLVVEGAIPKKDGGLYSVIARTDDYNLTAVDAVGALGPPARYVVAVGTCASFGGASAAHPNISDSIAVAEVLDRDVINVSGCPVNPDWIVMTLAHLMMFGEPRLDDSNRPQLFYGDTVHRHCQRRSYFEREDFAETLGDAECMFSAGCYGPRTPADCPYRQWMNRVSWPVKVNTPCIGCTTQGFPDSAAPFFAPLPDKGYPRGGGLRDRQDSDQSDHPRQRPPVGDCFRRG